MLLALLLFIALPIAAAGAARLTGSRTIANALEYVCDGNAFKFAAHLSAFTGAAWWILSGTFDLFIDIQDSGFLDILSDLLDDDPPPPRQLPRYEKNVPGAVTI